MANYAPEGASFMSMDVKVDGNLYQSDELKAKNLKFAILMTIFQITICFLYGFLFYTPPEIINVSSIITMICLALLIVAGFGLVFGYTKRLAWSGIGFNLFITALCLEFYPLINDFWTKTRIQQTNTPQLNFSYDNRYYNLYLANRDIMPTGQLTAYGNCLTNALKAALAMAVAFSSVLGRAGQMECLIINIFGVIGFELNRQIIQERIGSDSFGTFIIFTYGGFMGLALGVLSYLRQKNPENTIDETSLKKYNGDESTVLFSLLGAIIIFLLFPFLAYDVDAFIYQNNFSPYVSPLIIIIAMGCSMISSVGTSILINGHLVVRDVTHGILAGAIIIGSSTNYLANIFPVFVSAIVGGVIQALVQNLIQRKAINQGYVISTVSWSLFGLQGVLGGCFSSGWKALAKKKYEGDFQQIILLNYGEQYQFYAMLVSVGMGLAFGLAAGGLIYLTNFQKSSEYFDDGYYWRNHDCIRSLTRVSVPAKPASVKSQTVELQFEEGNQQEVNNRHAYL